MNEIGRNIFQKLKEKYYTNKNERFTILFCPYKVTLWDSMESIYEEAKADSETFAEIMYIPYFALQGDRPKEIQLEDTENFPHTLNFTKWDCIIFHYPYDNINNVTRPLLISTDLKAFCKHLVYVHYAFWGDNEVQLWEATCPGRRNADLIICESEKEAADTEKYLKMYCTKHIPEVVAWGSAKYDCLTKEYKVPANWQNKINNRRVVLLQTSLTPYLNNKEKLSQIEQIIQKYENKTDTCLLWRPHPLYRETIISHRPSDLKKFEELIKKVGESDKDILDRTTNLYRAINLSDEMISDRSSVLIPYKKTGKKLTVLER